MSAPMTRRAATKVAGGTADTPSFTNAKFVPQKAASASSMAQSLNGRPCISPARKTHNGTRRQAPDQRGGRIHDESRRQEVHKVHDGIRACGMDRHGERAAAAIRSTAQAGS